MKDIKVKVHPDNKTVKAYKYAPTLILVYHFLVNDTDQSIVTDSMGYRYKRFINPEFTGNVFYQYRRI